MFNESMENPGGQPGSRKRTGWLLVLIYLGIWILSLLSFWFWTPADQVMGYVLLYLYILLPAAAFTVSLLICLYSCFGKWTWLWIIPSGVLYMLAPYATLSAANTLSTGHLYAPDFTLLPVGSADLPGRNADRRPDTPFKMRKITCLPVFFNAIQESRERTPFIQKSFAILF